MIAKPSHESLLKNEELISLARIKTVSEGDATQHRRRHRLRSKFLSHAEARGIAPVPEEERTDESGFSLFTLFFSANFGLLP